MRDTKQLCVRLPEKSMKFAKLLCQHHGCTQARLIERLVHNAAEAAKAEVAARAAAPRQEPSFEDEAEEMDAAAFAQHRAQIDRREFE